MPLKHKTRWSPEDKKKLEWLWGEETLTVIATQLGRTPMAVWRQADSMGLGRANRGNMSLNAFAKHTGFAPAKIRKSARTMRMNLHRGLASEPGAKRDRTRDIIIDLEQQEKLLEFMLKHPFVFKNEGPDARMTRAGVWGIGRKPSACRRCSSTTKAHFSKGYCKPCYNTLYRQRKRKMDNDPITLFRNEFYFLSNFYMTKLCYDGGWYNSSEHAYQAAKTLDKSKRISVQVGANTNASEKPGAAKKWGQEVELRPDWDEVRIPIMREILRIKFQKPELAKLLLETGDRHLSEGNNHGDRFWGQVAGVGENHLGKLLMELREELKAAG